MRRWWIAGMFYIPAIMMLIQANKFEEWLIGVVLWTLALVVTNIVFYPDTEFSIKISDLF